MMKKIGCLFCACRTPSGVRGLKSYCLRSLCAYIRRTPSGVRGLKFVVLVVVKIIGSRTPSGVRGLKSYGEDSVIIEFNSRTPSGVRGLKSNSYLLYCVCLMSHPVRGAWIEIEIISAVEEAVTQSHPVRGAWIEIFALG